jgi:hypothetical protein
MRSFVGGGIVFAALMTFAPAADQPPARFFTVPIDKLEITEGSLPSDGLAWEFLAERRDPHDHWNALSNGSKSDRGYMRFQLDQPGEVEIIVEKTNANPSWPHVFLAVKSSAQGPMTGRCDFGLDRKRESRGTFRFRLPADANTVRAADWFEYGRASRVLAACSDPVRRSWPGAAWFRQRLTEVAGPSSRQLATLWHSAGGKPEPRANRHEPN